MRAGGIDSIFQLLIDDQLVVVELVGNAVGRAVHLELVAIRACACRWTSLSGGSCEISSTRGLAQGHRVFEARLAESPGGDLPGQRDGAHRIHGRLQAQMIRASDNCTWLVPIGLPSAVISTVACAACGRFERHIDRKPLAAEDLAGKAETDSSSRPGLGRPASAIVSIGMPSCCACQMARATLPRFSLPSETSSSRGTMPAGRAATPSRMAASRSVPWPGAPAVWRNLPAVLGPFVDRRVARDAGERNHPRPMTAAAVLQASAIVRFALQIFRR